MVNINKLMKQAQEMQEKIAREMAELQIEVSSGGGAVTVVMNGKKELVSLAIKKEAVDPEDVEMLEDLVKAAFNEAIRRVDEELGQQLGGMMPPGFTP
ncbi:MAG TPA: YbaB/EbfC family nucleoid-associated protein [Patescibacteria group bacterium]|jgi:DNA-binding YbaB/EbfC family protein|nr:YbaB/EbfC family nucleoid-associated protein [Patescibacteria group bacterium]